MTNSSDIVCICIAACVLLAGVAPIHRAEADPPNDEAPATQPAEESPQEEAPEETERESDGEDEKPIEAEEVDPEIEQAKALGLTDLELDDQSDMINEDSGEAVPASEVRKVSVLRSAGVGTFREPDPPLYARSMAEHAEYFGLEGWEDIDWLDLGIQQRTRFELRNNYYRAGQDSGEVFVMRSRAYFGVREVFDPFRFGLEFQDARRFGDAIDDRRNVDEADILQLFGELYFPDVAGKGYPLRIRAGRMSFDGIDRRLLARNRFRNTTNAYDGFRITLGQRTSDWELDFFATMPVEHRQFSLNPSDEERWLYGLNAYWRGWSPYITLEPYYFILDQDSKRSAVPDREIHTTGLHGFGVLGESGFDYDFNVAFQFGDHGDQSQRALAIHGEIGYMWDLPARPRAAVWINYASGDRDPNDGVNQRFDRLFGASHSMYGYSDLFRWQNLINPTAYFSFRPLPNLRMETFYRAYWLASKKDAWIVPGLRDPTGNSGRFIGQEIDLRLNYQVGRHMAVDVGYAYFMRGSFVDNTAPGADDSHFLYVQFTMRL